MSDECPHCASFNRGTRFAMPTGYVINGGNYCCPDPWHDEPSAESTSAALARVERERDALRTVRDQLGRDVTMAHATIRALKDLFRSGKYSDELCPRCGIEHQLELAADAATDRSPRPLEGEPS